MRRENTLRELMEKISGVTFEYATSTEEAYEIACMVLIKLLKAASSPAVEAGDCPARYLH